MKNHAARRAVRVVARLRAPIALGLICLAVTPGAARAAAASPLLDPEERALCKQVNAFRGQNGAAPLRLSLSLTKAAHWLSLDMATRNVFGHTDSRGRAFGRRLGEFGYSSPTIGENIAGGDESAAATFSFLKSSPAHRRNLLRTKFTVIGIGRAYRARSMLGWYWTTTFGATADRAVVC